MDKLSKNPFLAAMGVLGLVAVIGFVILVLPAQGEASKKTAAIQKEVSTINKQLGDVPGRPNMEEWTAGASGLKARYKDRLQEMTELDQNLGEWFSDLDNNSTFTSFMNRYDDERDKLQKELIEKGVLLGSPKAVDNGLEETQSPGFNWILKTEIVARSPDDERASKEILQKRFNINRAIVNALTTGSFKPKSRRLLDVTFLERFRYTSAPVGVQGAPGAIPIDLKRYSGFTGTGGGNFAESFLPLNGDKPPAPSESDKPGESAPASAPAVPERHLGKTITFGFAVVMDYNQVPDLLRNLIQPSVPPQLNLSIVGVNLFVAEPNPTEVKDKRTFEPGTLTPEAKDALKKEEEARAAAYQAPQVHVYITCQVFDLDPAAVPAFIRKD